MPENQSVWVGNAVVRNREKRRLREGFRLSQHDLPAIDMVVLIKKPSEVGFDYAESVLTLAQRGATKLARRAAGRQQ